MISDLTALFHGQVFKIAFKIFYALWPIWLPIVFLNIAFSAWLNYVRRLWIKSQGSILLELRIPKDVPKSPEAMEFVLNGIWESAAPGSLADAFWEGKLRDWFSLEIISIGGQVRFYIWTLPRWKKIIESRVYAQYPEAEVVEAKDYAMDLTYDPEKISLFGLTTKLVKDNDAFPIKTYVDYELDKVALKEQEEAVDPITPLIEYLGTLKGEEIAGIQILIQAHRKEGLLDGRIIPKPDWKDSVKKAVKEILEKQAHIKPEKDKQASLVNLTEDQKQAIKSIERNASKLPFDSMIRMLYIAPKEEFDKVKGMGLIGSTRQFGTHILNGIRPDSFMSVASPWQDYKDIKKKRIQRGHLEAWKRRSFFNPPYKHFFGKPFVLSTEEVATLFHFPGAMAATPTLTRAPSKKAEAPANLPI